jgi:hypothetical protein
MSAHSVDGSNTAQVIGTIAILKWLGVRTACTLLALPNHWRGAHV